MSLNQVFLKPSTNGWQFISEAVLEDFVWLNLKALFGWTPLQRQFMCSGEICDIVAVTPAGQLVVIELKNAEDRSIIQQLTRYFANVIQEKPFEGQVNDALPVRLVAIAPSFHRHSLIDQQHSTLHFELWQFTVETLEHQHWLCLARLEHHQTVRHSIPHQDVTISEGGAVPPPPEPLLTWLSTCTPPEQAGFLSIRAALLSRGVRMKEWGEGNWIRYGSGKTKLAAEFGYRPKLRRLVLFVWMPTPSSLFLVKAHAPSTQKVVIGRLRLWTDGETLSHLGHVPDGYGEMRTYREWEEVPREKRPHMVDSLSHKSRVPLEIDPYITRWPVETPSGVWEFMTETLLETWNSRV